MKISEFRKLLKEEITNELSAPSSTKSLSSSQMKLLKELYTAIKPYYKTLSNEQIIATIESLKSLYKD